jgi:hypothetical protein
VVVSHVTGEKSKTVTAGKSLDGGGAIKTGPFKNTYSWVIGAIVLVIELPDVVLVLVKTHAAWAVCGLTIAPAPAKIPVANAVLASRSALVAPLFRPSVRALPAIIRNMGPPARLNLGIRIIQQP